MEENETIWASDIKMSPRRKPWRRELTALEIMEIELYVEKEIERRFKAKDRANSLKGLLIMLVWGFCLMILMNVPSINGAVKMILMAIICGGFGWLMVTKDSAGLKEKEKAKKALLIESINAAESS